MLNSLSFNALFVEAAERGLQLNNFCQLPSGVWRCNWRIDGKTPWFGQFAEHARPFDAMLNAYVLADMTAPGKTRGVDPTLSAYHPAEPEAAPTRDEAVDLFG